MRYSGYQQIIVVISALMLLMSVLLPSVNWHAFERPVVVTPCHQSQTSTQSTSSCAQYGAKYLSLLSANQLLKSEGLSVMSLALVMVLVSLIWADVLFKPPRFN